VEILLLLLAFPLIWPFLARMIWKTTITWAEMGIQIVAVSALIVGVWFAGQYDATADTEYLNGSVTNKSRVTVSCEHSYDCNCYTTYSTDSKGNTTSSTYCDTCYDHYEDYDWNVVTSVGNFNVMRVDDQGEDEPRSWTVIKKGQPASLSHDYTNYIKAVPESLFNNTSFKPEQYAEMIPDYPHRHDYIKVDRIVPVGVSIPNKKELNEHLSKRLIEIGPKKQANINIVVAKTGDQTYRYALEAAWLGGKKNDVTVVIGAPEYPKIAWVDVMTLGQNAGNAMLAVDIRDSLMALGTFDIKVVDTVADSVLVHFSRKAMKDFEYLEDSIEPPTWVIVTSVIISILGSLFGTWFFHNYDVNRGGFVSSRAYSRYNRHSRATSRSRKLRK